MEEEKRGEEEEGELNYIMKFCVCCKKSMTVEEQCSLNSCCEVKTVN